MLNSYVALDTETTGINVSSDRLIEIGMAKVVDGIIIEEYSQLIYPGIKVPERVSDLTGISNADLAGMPRIEDVIEEVVDFIGDMPILGHNIIFDYAFLKKAAINNGLKIPNRGIDTLKIARRVLPELEHKNLEFLCAHLGVDPGHSHRAYDDAVSASEVYKKMYGINQKDPGFEETIELVYTVKKDSPITPKQKSYILGLMTRHGLSSEDIDMPVDEMSKSQASRTIDKILSQYGRF